MWIVTKENILELSQALFTLKVQVNAEFSMLKSVITHLEAKGFIRLYLFNFTDYH